MKKDLDKKLYDDYLNGEKQAFEFLYDKYKNKITYFIYNIVKDYQKSEDLTQETFIYIMESKIKEDISFKYYIYLVAKSKALNYINKENRRNKIADEYLSNNEQVEKDVLDIVVNKETNKELLESINLLDEKYKNAVYLVNIENLSYQETADILGETLQNTKSLVHRGKKQLRKILLKKGYDIMNKTSKVCLILIGSIVLISGIAYASSILYNFIQRKGTTQYYENMNDYFEVTDNEMLYKSIDNYDKYLEYKEKWDNIIDVSKDDFNDNFLIVIVSSWRMPDITIKDIMVNDTTLYITVDNTLTQDAISRKEYMVSALLSKELLKENIKLLIYEESIESDKYISLSDIPQEYNYEKAIEDNCVVVVNNEIVGNTKIILDNFINNTKNNINDYVRITIYENRSGKNELIINDVRI